MTDKLPTEASTEEIAGVLGISSRRLQQLAADGLVEGRIRPGMWNLKTTLRSYLAHVQLSALSSNPN